MAADERTSATTGDAPEDLVVDLEVSDADATAVVGGAISEGTKSVSSSPPPPPPHPGP